MTDIYSIINQQYGFVRLRKYDCIFSKLRCVVEDDYAQLFDDGHYASYGDTPVFACRFALKETDKHMLAMANEDGKLSILDVRKKGRRFGAYAHHNAIFDLAWSYHSTKLVTASGDHSIKLFDISNESIREERIFYGHSRSVKTVSFRKDDPFVFASGGRDGNIIIWDTRSEMFNLITKPDQRITNAHMMQPPLARSLRRIYCRFPMSAMKSVTSLVFRDDNNLISCAAGDGLLKMWDLRKTRHNYKNRPAPKCVIAYPGEKAKSGFSGLVIDNTFSRLYANCLDNTVYCYNAATFNNEPIMQYRGHQNSTFYVKSSVSPDGNYLISGSSDENAYIWRTNQPQPYAKLVGHKAEVTCVAWYQDTLPIIVTCSDDMKHKVWRITDDSVLNDWWEIGRGETELIDVKDIRPPQQSWKRKRSRVSEDHSQQSKKIRTECTSCFGAVNGTSKCSKCAVRDTANINTDNDPCIPKSLKDLCLERLAAEGLSVPDSEEIFVEWPRFDELDNIVKSPLHNDRMNDEFFADPPNACALEFPSTSNSDIDIELNLEDDETLSNNTEEINIEIKKSGNIDKLENILCDNSEPCCSASLNSPSRCNKNENKACSEKREKIKHNDKSCSSTPSTNLDNLEKSKARSLGSNNCQKSDTIFTNKNVTDISENNKSLHNPADNCTLVSSKETSKPSDNYQNDGNASCSKVTTPRSSSNDFSEKASTSRITTPRLSGNDSSNKTYSGLSVNTPKSTNTYPIEGTPSTSFKTPKSSRQLFKKKEEPLNSPTLDLPNFVVDGVAPHINNSPMKKKDVDWLTKMRRVKFRRELFENYNRWSPSKTNQSSLSLSPRSSLGKKKTSSPQCSLLKFFKVRNSVKCDNLTCSNKTHDCKLRSPKHSTSQ